MGVCTRTLDMIAESRRLAIEHARRVVERWNAAIAAGYDVWWSPTRGHRRRHAVG
jgi:hypothetical protein